MSQTPKDTGDEAHRRADGADNLYSRRRNDQFASLSQRLRRRKITGRKIAVYLVTLVVLVGAQPETPSFLIGAVLVTLGCVARLWTFGHLQKNQSLITTGPYRHSRNPAYFGSALILAGLVIAAGNNDGVLGFAMWAFGLCALGVFFLCYLPRKYRREYRRLHELFPQQCARHADNVPDFFPRITPWRSGDEQAFSWACVRANHELIWAPACILALTIMWFC